VKLAWLAPALLAVPLCAEPESKVRVFLAGSEPEKISGEANVAGSPGTINVTRSTPSYDIESMRTFAEHCPAALITTRRDNADVILRIERDVPNPATPFVKANRMAVFSLNEDLVYVTRARLLRNASKDTCRAILNHVKR
jgi:hypothetical protein